MVSAATFSAFRLQAGACRHFGSTLYADILDAALSDLEARGPVHRLVEGWEGDPLRGFLPLRVMGAVHERVLAGQARELAHFYPSVGGRTSSPGAWHAFRDVVEADREALRPRLRNFPQTNEVRRCTGLLGGFLAIARRTRRPLRLREIGASAGLNLLWDRYSYRLGPHRWGDPGSPLTLTTEWEGPPAAFDEQPTVESRAGCDLDPRRITDAKQLRALEAYVWADQPERLERLRAAVRLAREDPPQIAQASAGDWLAAQLAPAPEDVTRVVFHSSVWIYLGEAEQKRIRELLEEQGARATARTPLAWLRHEDGENPAQIEVRLRLWPPGEELHLADSHPHGRRVRWRGCG